MFYNIRNLDSCLTSSSKTVFINNEESSLTWICKHTLLSDDINYYLTALIIKYIENWKSSSNKSLYIKYIKSSNEKIYIQLIEDYLLVRAEGYIYNYSYHNLLSEW